MALIHILDQGVERDVDESLLVRTDTREETDDYITEAVEYRFPASAVIVHRSAHVTMKRWPEGMNAIAQNLGT
jgi:hypothetical protein